VDRGEAGVSDPTVKTGRSFLCRSHRHLANPFPTDPETLGDGIER
jgi:hypothetical protein